MTLATGRYSGLTAVAATLLVVAACGGSTSTTAAAQQTTTLPATTTTTATTQQQTSTSEIPPEDIPKCEGPVDNVALGSTINAEVKADDPELSRMYFCVDVPTGIDSFTVSLTGLTADISLFVGYPDLETVKKGGVGLRTSSTNDAADHGITIDIDPDLIWSPGSYYIEVSASNLVSAGNLTISSVFTLTVSTP